MGGAHATFNAQLPQTVSVRGDRVTTSKTDYYVNRSPAPQRRSESRMKMQVQDMRPLAGIEATVATGDLYGRSSSGGQQVSEKFMNVQDQRPFPAIEATVAVGELMQQGHSIQQQHHQVQEAAVDTHGKTTLNLHVRRPQTAQVPVQKITISSQDPRSKSSEPGSRPQQIRGSYNLNDAVPQQHIEYLAEAKEKHRQGMQIDGRSAVLIETTEVKSKKKKHEQGSAQNQLSEQQTSYSIYNPETKEMTQIIVEETETGGKGRAQQQQYVTQQSSQYNEQYQQLNYNEVRSSARSDALRARSASPGAAFYRPGSSAERRTSSRNENMIKRRRRNARTGQFEYVLVPESELVRIGSGYVTPEPGSKRQSRPNSRLEERMNVSITSMRQDDPNKTKRIWNAQTNQWEEYNESQTVRMVSSSPQQSKPPMPERQRSAMVVNQQGGAIPVSSQFELVKSHQQSQQQVSRQDQQTIKNELIRMQQSSGQTQYQENGESIFMVTDSGAKSKRVWNPHIMKFEFQTVDGQVVPPPGQETVQMHQ